MALKQTLHPIRNRRKKTTKTSKKKVNLNVKGLPRDYDNVFLMQMRGKDYRIPNSIPRYTNLPQYYDGTPLGGSLLDKSDYPNLYGNTISQEGSQEGNQEGSYPQGLNAGVQAGAMGLSAIGDIVGNNNVDTTVENTHDNTFEGLMAEAGKSNAAASKGINNSNVAGSALKGAGQGLSMGMATGNPYVAAGAAVVGGVTGLITGNKAEKDRIAELKRQADEKVSQAEQIKLNNLNSNVPTYQMATGGEISPMIPKKGTIPNSIPPPEVNIMKMIGYKPNWGANTLNTIKNKALSELDIHQKEFDKNYKNNSKEYMQQLSDKFNHPRDIPNYEKSSMYTKYKPVKLKSGQYSLSKNINYNRMLDPAYSNQMQIYKVPYSPAAIDAIRESNYLNSLYKYFNINNNIRAYGGNINMDNNNVITKYSGQTHEGQDGGIPIDNNGNPSILTGNKTVALTEDGEVNYKGYIFSNRLKYQ